jgi:hypothetical protein
MPQPPQLFASLLVSTQRDPVAPMQHVPVVQISFPHRHRPLRQIASLGHSLPHRPQFFGSVCTSRHMSGAQQRFGSVHATEEPHAQDPVDEHPPVGQQS